MDEQIYQQKLLCFQNRCCVMEEINAMLKQANNDYTQFLAILQNDLRFANLVAEIDPHKSLKLVANMANEISVGGETNRFKSRLYFWHECGQTLRFRVQTYEVNGVSIPFLF